MTLPDPRKWKADYRVQWHGVTMDRYSAILLDRVQDRVSFPIAATQGSFSSSVGASAGSHDGTGAIDFSIVNLSGPQRMDLLRAVKIEFGAGWIRLPEEGPWPLHLHAGAFGSPAPAPLLALQIRGYKEGRNGLGSWPFGLDRYPWRPEKWPHLNFGAYKRRQVWKWRVSKVTHEIGKARNALQRLLGKRDDLRQDRP